MIIIGLIFYIFNASDRQGISREKNQPKALPQTISNSLDEPVKDNLVEVERVKEEMSVIPGQRARKLISQYRKQGKPYPFKEVMDKTLTFSNEGSLADAHLMLFFAAREGYVEAMMELAEMSDPALFRTDNNLLDRADAIQAYKWYRLALDMGFEPARERLDNLRGWAQAEAEYGDGDAQQLLLNFN